MTSYYLSRNKAARLCADNGLSFQKYLKRYYPIQLNDPGQYLEADIQLWIANELWNLPCAR